MIKKVKFQDKKTKVKRTVFTDTDFEDFKNVLDFDLSIFGKEYTSFSELINDAIPSTNSEDPIGSLTLTYVSNDPSNDMIVEILFTEVDKVNIREPYECLISTNDNKVWAMFVFEDL